MLLGSECLSQRHPQPWVLGTGDDVACMQGLSVSQQGSLQLHVAHMHGTLGTSGAQLVQLGSSLGCWWGSLV
jgi:hypothetical protein